MPEAVKRDVSAQDAEFLIDKKLRPLGIVAQADGSAPELGKLDPLLALKFRAALVPERFVNALTTIFRPLFLPPVVIAVLAGLVALDGWLFFVHGIAGSLRGVLYHPVYVMIILGLVILSAAFHETGHATACRYGGAKPGVMGFGIYIVWPAFYTDVTDAYRLSKGGRLRTDLGGVYFNVIFILATAGAYAVTGFEPLLLLIPLQHIEIIHQFLPFIRLDGYYIVSDLVGVPDMFSRIKPTLKSFVPGREADERVTELKRWVRIVVTIYVFTVIPVLLLMFGLMVINMPRIFSTAYDSFFVQLHKVEHPVSTVLAIFAGFQLVILVLPTLGLVVTFWQLARRIGVGAWSFTDGRPLLRAPLVAGATAAAVFTGFVLWPNGDYRPIQPAERGTLQGGFQQLASVQTGRPGLTPQEAKKLHGAPALSKHTLTKPKAPAAPAATTTAPATTSTTTTATATTAPATTAAATTAPVATATTVTTTSTPAAPVATDTTATDTTATVTTTATTTDTLTTTTTP